LQRTEYTEHYKYTVRRKIKSAKYSKHDHNSLLLAFSQCQYKCNGVRVLGTLAALSCTS